MYSLDTPRLALRPFTEDDFDFLVALNGDPEVARFIAYGVPRKAAETRSFLDHVLAGYREDSLGHLAVCLRDSGAPVGRCGVTLTEIETGPAAGTPPQCFWFRGSAPVGMLIVRHIELGYTFARQHWGQGYATEAAAAVRDFAFRELGFPQLFSAITPANVASSNVARKLGLTRSGFLTCFGKSFERHELARDRWVALTTAA